MKIEQSETQKCTSSTSKENSKQLNATVEFGRRLVKELDLESSCNTLGRWMAHYVSELIFKVENAVGDDKAAAEKECYEAILNLWLHRENFPNNIYPHYELNQLLRTLQSLDPEDASPRYHKQLWLQLQGDEEGNEEIKEWTDTAREIDLTARFLIKNCLVNAAQHIPDKSEELINLVEATEFELTPEQLFVNFVSSKEEEDEDSTTDERVKKLNSLLEHLTKFSNLAQVYTNTVKDELHEISLKSNQQP